MTAPRNDDRRLSDFWNALTRGQTADAGALDPSTAECIRRLDALSLTPVPGSARERARQRVFQPTSLPEENTMTAVSVPIGYPSPNGHRESALSAPRRISNRSRPKWAWAALAAALLLILGGIGSYFAGAGNHSLFGGAGTRQPESIPAATVESGWPQFRGGAARTGYTTDPGPGGALDLRWTFTTPDDVPGGGVTDGSSAYIYSRKGVLYALDAATGAQRWALDLSPNEYSDENRWPVPAVADGVLYTGTFDGNMVAIDTAGGSVMWQRSLSDQPIVASPLVVDGQIYQVTPEGSVVCIDASTGDTVWTWTGDTVLSNWAPAAGGGLFYIADENGDLVAIDTATGTTKWVADLKDARRNPAYADGVVYVGGDSLSYYAIDATDGSVLWKTDPGTGDQTLNPVVTPNELIATFMNGPMEALDLKSGAVLWSVEGPGESLSPHASALAVYCASADLTSLVAYDLKTGAELGRISADGLGAVAAISGDTIIYGNADVGGTIRAIGPNDATPSALVAGPATAISAASPIPGSATPVPVATPSIAFDGSQVQLLWQSTGSAEAPLQIPLGSAIGPDGNLYLADAGLNAIQIIAPDGTFVSSWGEAGSGPGQFNGPAGIAFDDDGNRYVVDSGNNRIQKFASDGTFVLQWGSKGDGNGQFDGVNSIAIDRELGQLYVSEFVNNRVQVFDLDGNFIDTWGSLGTKDGQFVHATGIAVNNDGLVFVSEAHNGAGARVQIFDQSGALQGALPDTFTEVDAMGFDASGNVYVVEFMNNRIQVYDPDFQLIGTIENVDGAGPFKGPAGLSIDADGNLYVSDTDNHRLVKLQMPPVS